jgi:uncharacterized protein (TIGR00299 family) protein
MEDISIRISKLNLSDKIKSDIEAVYKLIADAESKAHNVPVSEIHFHEVGTLDALADIAAVCMLMDKLNPEQVVVSPINVGGGTVECAHGILPVPAPATAHILKGVPTYSGKIQSELCTPTGAALIKHFATKFGEMPMIVTNNIGYGMGSKEFEVANCLRAFWGDTLDVSTPKNEDSVLELSCNIDDMTGEAIGFAMSKLLEAGALDVYTIPIGMKKSRPGFLLQVLCRESDRDIMLTLIFKHTSTLGVREAKLSRHVLDRSINVLETPYGTVREKISKGYGVERKKYEYDDLCCIAKEQNVSIDKAKTLIENYLKR